MSGRYPGKDSTLPTPPLAECEWKPAPGDPESGSGYFYHRATGWISRLLTREEAEDLRERER